MIEKRSQGRRELQKDIQSKRELKTITHSMTQCFQECRQKWDYRYNKQIVPVKPIRSLDVGSAVHAGLEFWFKFGLRAGAVDAALSRGAESGLTVDEMIKVRVMIEKYCDVYAQEDFEVVSIEDTFTLPLVNPVTGRISRTFAFRGKTDGVVKKDGKYWILEHKTTSSITEQYINRIDIDAQIALYGWALERMGTPIEGAIYDIIQKPSCVWKVGETDEEFEVRKAALIAKSKTGKTTAKKQEPDTYDTFFARCNDAVTADSFRRVEVPLTKDRKREAVQNMWFAAKDMMTAKIYPNTGSCTKYDGCQYLGLCREHGDVTKCPDEFKHEMAHIELEESHVG